MIQNQANIDKETENNEWWKNAFNDMFTINSGDIQELINNVTNNINLPSGEIADMKIILDMLQNENPEDFIIGWNTTQTHISIKGQQIEEQFKISGDSINFSKIERENQTLHQVMIYTRVILTISISGILLRQYYLTILSILGVNITIYGEETENKERLKKADQKAKAETRRQIYNANQERIREYNKIAKKRGWNK